MGIKRALLNRMCRPISSREWNTPRSGHEAVIGGFFASFASPLSLLLPQIFSEKRWRRPRTEIGHGSPITPFTPTLKLVISPTPSPTTDIPSFSSCLVFLSSGFFARRFCGSAGLFSALPVGSSFLPRSTD